ncbi:MAG: glycosyltransferase family 4 protein [Planctomycetota bacterium]|nr:glycosyltransferase family 4 protein [Planctomycetota bacterium]
MRIMHVITRLIVGGAQENTILSCEGLQAEGHEVHLLAGPTTGPEGSLVDRARAGKYHYEEIPELVRQVSPLRDRRAMTALRKRFAALQPDVVHTHSSKAGVLGRLAAHAAGVPAIVHTIHGMSFNRTQPWVTRAAYAAAERYCAKRCHAIVSVADAMTAHALSARIGRPDQYHTIRSGIVVADFDSDRQDPAVTRAQWGNRPDDVVVGTVARLFRNKGYEQLIEVIDRAVTAEPKLRFVWIGDGAHRPAYEAELSRRNLRERVTITGLLPPNEMPRVLAAMDILAHTSQWEGLPRAAVQALLMQKPVVSFDIDGAPEVVLPGQTGELADLGDIPAFSEALVMLARDPDRRRRYGESGRNRCSKEFDHNVMVDRLEQLYLQLTRAARRTI